MEFKIFGTSHLIVLVLTMVLTLAAIFTARLGPGGALPRRIGYVLASILLLSFPANNLNRIREGYWEIRYDLPMQLCDWAGIAIIAALYTRKQFLFEIAYYWVTAGSFQALITPANLDRDFPDFFFFTFMISHATLVIGSFYMLFGLRLRPTPGSVLRVFLAAQVWLIAALFLNYLLDGNYGFLMRKPEGASLLDALPGWPWYILVGEGIAIAAFTLLYAPFYIGNRAARE